MNRRRRSHHGRRQQPAPHPPPTLENLLNLEEAHTAGWTKRTYVDWIRVFEIAEVDGLLKCSKATLHSILFFFKQQHSRIEIGRRAERKEPEANRQPVSNSHHVDSRRYDSSGNSGNHMSFSDSIVSPPSVHAPNSHVTNNVGDDYEEQADSR